MLGFWMLNIFYVSLESIIFPFPIYGEVLSFIRVLWLQSQTQAASGYCVLSSYFNVYFHPVLLFMIVDVLVVQSSVLDLWRLGEMLDAAAIFYKVVLDELSCLVAFLLAGV